ncbi:Uncharacterized protein PBTT_03091 [Plasmodiophora brassicae]|uniref:Uncharacterized protein n=1 Tax=Plasmodiophora brassicae TaxID=37360 RepID=A0A0G4J7K2_PLABS|nr:hypothetical protein PBRA_002986 [Plasmodiophora brassicae]
MAGRGDVGGISRRSAQGVAALAGLDATLWNEISDDEENENARVAVEAAERVLDDPALAGFLGGAYAGPSGRARDDPVLADLEHDVANPPGGSIANGDTEETAIMPEDHTADPGRDAVARARRRVQHHTPTMMTAIALRCIANAVAIEAWMESGSAKQVEMLARLDQLERQQAAMIEWKLDLSASLRSIVRDVTALGDMSSDETDSVSPTLLHSTIVGMKQQIQHLDRAVATAMPESAEERAAIFTMSGHGRDTHMFAFEVAAKIGWHPTCTSCGQQGTLALTKDSTFADRYRYQCRNPPPPTKIFVRLGHGHCNSTIQLFDLRFHAVDRGVQIRWRIRVNLIRVHIAQSLDIASDWSHRGR